MSKEEYRPHIAWSKYWNAYVATFAGVQRIGDTPRQAYDTLQFALIRGVKR